VDPLQQLVVQTAQIQYLLASLHLVAVEAVVEFQQHFLQLLVAQVVQVVEAVMQLPLHHY
jgi:hypothetical protein